MNKVEIFIDESLKLWYYDFSKSFLRVPGRAPVLSLQVEYPDVNSYAGNSRTSRTLNCYGNPENTLLIKGSVLMSKRTVYFETGEIVEAENWGKNKFNRTIKLVTDCNKELGWPVRYWFRPCDEWIKASNKFIDEKGFM